MRGQVTSHLSDNREVEGSTRRSTDLVHEALREAILSGALPQGEVLSQVQLAEQFGVSRTPLREALRMLQAEGFVDSVPNRRVRVANLSVSDLEQLYAQRIVLEALAVRLSVSFFSQADFRQLRGLLRAMDIYAAAQDVAGWDQPHRIFHRGLSAHAGVRIASQVMLLGDRAQRYRRLYVTQEPRAWWQTAAEHKAILDACERRDGEAAGIQLGRHLARTALTVLAIVAPDHDAAAIRTAVSLIGAGSTPAEVSALQRSGQEPTYASSDG
jgi:DNA-binding GntR family transcriptional regulator